MIGEERLSVLEKRRSSTCWRFPGEAYIVKNEGKVISSCQLDTASDLSCRVRDSIED